MDRTAVTFEKGIKLEVSCHREDCQDKTCARSAGDFAVFDEDDADLERLECIAKQADKNSPRPRRGSRLDAVLSSPFNRMNVRARPPSIDLGQPAVPLENMRRERRLSTDSIDGGASSHPSSDGNMSDDAEQDVCFPIEEQQGGVDFDELDDFVLQNRRASFVSQKSTQVAVHEKASPDSSPSNESEITAGPISKSASVPRQDAAVCRLRQYLPAQMSAPDRFSFFASEEDDTVHASALGGLVQPDQSFRDLFRDQRGTWWLDVMCPTDAELRVLAKSFGIHPLTTEDIRVQETREKVELFDAYYFICFKSFEHDTLEPVKIYVVVFKQGLVSFHFAPTGHPANVRRRIRQLRDYVSISADWISYAIIDDVTDAFMPIITEIERESDAIEDAVLVARSESSEQTLRIIGDCRKKVLSVFRLLYGKADVIKMFAKRCNDRDVSGTGCPRGHPVVVPTGEIGLYLGDIQDHLVTMTQSLLQTEKILSRAHANYLAMLSTDSVSSNNRLNANLAKLTLVATMLVPMNLLTGLFGMNVRVPFGDGGSLAPFFVIVGIIVAVVTSAVLFARRSRALRF
ncbi:Mg(2+) transporter [Savitreella phatthalungensis]